MFEEKVGDKWRSREVTNKKKKKEGGRGRGGIKGREMRKGGTDLS